MRKAAELSTREKFTEGLRLLTEAKEELADRHDLGNRLIRVKWMVNEAVAFIDAQTPPAQEPTASEPEAVEEEVSNDA